jgi:hypothetical protein
LMEGVGQGIERLRGRGAARLNSATDLAIGSYASAAGSRAPAAARQVRPVPSPLPKLHAAPGQRRGCLKNGNPCGDYLKSPRCGAHTRAGCGCRQPAMANGRCRLHGGLSTGPRTAEGLARSRRARLTHGYRSRELIGLRRRAAHAARRLRGLTRALSAGHGVHRSNPALTPGRSVAKIKHRGHRDHGGVLPPSVNPSAAGHGVHRPISKLEPIGVHPRPPAAKPASPAGHGVHRSFRDRLRSSVLMPAQNSTSSSSSSSGSALAAAIHSAMAGHSTTVRQ